MHAYSDDELFASEAKVLKIADNSKMLDSEVVSEMFKKVKEKGILKEPIGIEVGKANVIKVPKMEINDYVDQLIYYRKGRHLRTFPPRIQRVLLLFIQLSSEMMNHRLYY